MLEVGAIAITAGTRDKPESALRVVGRMATPPCVPGTGMSASEARSDAVERLNRAQSRHEGHRLLRQLSNRSDGSRGTLGPDRPSDSLYHFS
jgi:hypothetical protein